MSWPKVKLDSIKADVRYAFVGGPFGSNLTTRDYVEEGIPVIRGNNLPIELFFETADPSEVRDWLHSEVFVTRLEVAVG